MLVKTALLQKLEKIPTRLNNSDLRQKTTANASHNNLVPRKTPPLHNFAQRSYTSLHP
jgi:hypothetical protein